MIVFLVLGIDILMEKTCLDHTQMFDVLIRNIGHVFLKILENYRNILKKILKYYRNLFPSDN